MIVSYTLLSWLNRKLKAHRMLRDVATVATGTVVGQLVALAASPVLTRLYAPEAFGTLSTFVTVVVVLTALSGLRLEQAIPLSKDAIEARWLLILAAISSMALAIVLAVVLPTQKPLLRGLFGAHSAGLLTWLLPLTVLVASAVSVLSQWAIRAREFSQISQVRLVQGAGGALLQVFLGLLGVYHYGLLFGQVVSQTAGVLRLVGVSLRTGLRPMPAPLKVKDARKVLCRYKQFPKYGVLAAMSSILSNQVAFLILPLLFGQGVTGLLALGYRILNAPFGVLGQSLSNVFVAHARDAHEEGTLGSTTAVMVHRLLAVGIPLTALVAFSAPEFFAVVFGERWRGAAFYAALLAPDLLLGFAAGPVITSQAVAGQLRPVLFAQLTILAGRVSGLLAGGATGNPDIAVLVYAMVGAAGWLGFIVISLTRLGQDAIALIRGIVTWSILGLLTVVPLVLTQVFFPQHPGFELVAAVVALALVPLAVRANLLIAASMTR